MNSMDNKSDEFFSIHVHLQPSDPWKAKNSSHASEDCKRKANCEGDKFTPSFLVGDHTIIAKKGEGFNVYNMVKEYFGSDPKGGYKSELFLSHIRKKKTRPRRLGVNQKMWWRSRPPKYLYK